MVLRPRSIAWCCHLENLTAKSLSVYYESFMTTVTTTLSCSISEIKRDMAENRNVSYCTSGSPSEYCHSVWYRKTRMVWLPNVRKFNATFSRFDTIPACDRQMDRQTGRNLATAIMQSVTR